jgi:hypothetical protein
MVGATGTGGTMTGGAGDGFGAASGGGAAPGNGRGRGWEVPVVAQAPAEMAITTRRASRGLGTVTIVTG